MPIRAISRAGVGLEPRQIQRRLDQLGLPQKGVLVQELETLRLGCGARADRQDAGRGIIGAHALPRLMAQRDAHGGQHGFGMGGQIALACPAKRSAARSTASM
jgi:hypothetical protein